MQIQCRGGDMKLWGKYKHTKSCSPVREGAGPEDQAAERRNSGDTCKQTPNPLSPGARRRMKQRRTG